MFQRFEKLDTPQVGQRFGTAVATPNFQFGDAGNRFHVLPRDLSHIGNNVFLFQKIREYRVEERGEIRIGGCPCLGNGYLHGLRSAGDVHISRAGLLRDSGRGGQCDALAAGRADCGRDGQPVRVFAGDGECPGGRGREGEGRRAVVDGVERILGLFDGQRLWGVRSFILAAGGKGKEG